MHASPCTRGGDALAIVIQPASAPFCPEKGVVMSSEPEMKSDAQRGSPRLRKVLGRGFARASLSKLNLIVLGAAATGAALSESWSVLLFAAAGFAVLTAIKLCD